jgi:hypothetical protein
MLARTILIAIAGLALSGCSSLSEFGSLRKESLRNDQGHVIGYKEMLRNERTGEVMAQIALFTPMRGERNEVIGYEEQSRDGGSAVIRGLDGRAIGSRWSDLRSRSTNGRSRGVTVVFLPADTKVAAVEQPKIHELMASLSASELRRIQ